jgi:hypothetical protein
VEAELASGIATKQPGVACPELGIIMNVTNLLILSGSYPIHMSFLRSSDCFPDAPFPCKMNISVLALLIVLSSREWLRFLPTPLALGRRAATAGGGGRIGSGLFMSVLPHLVAWRDDAERERCGCAVIVVVNVVCVTCDGERWRCGVRMLFTLTVRVVVSEVDRLKVEDCGLKVWVCFDGNRWRVAGCEGVLALTFLRFVIRIESLLRDSAGCVDSSSSVCFE